MKLVLFILLFPMSAFASAVIPGTADAVQCTSTTGTSYSHNFNIPTGSNLAVEITVAYGNNGNGNNAITISTVTLGGSSIASDAVTPSPSTSNQGSGFYGWIQNYVVPAPPTGAAVTLALTTSATTFRICASAMTFTNVNQAHPVRPNSFVTKNVNNVFGGTISASPLTQVGDIVFSTFNASSNSLTSQQTATGTGGSNATGYGVFGSAYSASTVPLLQFGWGGAASNNYVVMNAFSIESPDNSVVVSSINGVTPGDLPGNIRKSNGVNIGSAVSGYVGSTGGMVMPAGTTPINYYFDASGGTSGSNPTTTTAGNSATGDYLYHTWSIAGMGNGMTYSNAGSPPSSLLFPVSDNSGVTNTGTGSLGLLCTTGTSVHCGVLSDIDTNLGNSSSIGFWIWSDCTGASQDCGEQMGLSNSGETDGLGIHINANPTCLFNGFSIDPGTFSGCLTGAYTPSTWYRINIQMNRGGPTFTATFSTSVPDITATQTLSPNVAVTVSNSGGALPSGLSAATPYYVLASGLSGSSFRLAARQGGTPIQVTTTGSGTNTFQIIHQIAVCSATGTFIGTLNIPASATASTPARVLYGVNGEEPSVAGFHYRYAGVTVDGSGKFSHTGCIL